jgi:hypothetical protein
LHGRSPCTASDWQNFRTSYSSRLPLYRILLGHNFETLVTSKGVISTLSSEIQEADQLPALAEQLVQEGGIDVIVTVSLPPTMAVYAATQTIPIVAFVAADPVAAGIAKNLAHPGGNVTGVAVFAEETNVKRVELMREALPLAVRLAMVGTKIGLTPQNVRSTQEGARRGSAHQTRPRSALPLRLLHRIAGSLDCRAVRRTVASAWPQIARTGALAFGAQIPGGHGYTRTTHADGERDILEHWNIHGAGHAWSGGSGRLVH